MEHKDEVLKLRLLVGELKECIRTAEQMRTFQEDESCKDEFYYRANEVASRLRENPRLPMEVLRERYLV